MNTSKYRLQFVIFTNAHTQIYNSVISIFIDSNKIIGIGPNNFRNKFGLYNKTSCSTHPHNFFFQLLLETRVVGLLVYILIYSYFIRDMIVNIFKKTNKY